jgi:hypothetical protein
MALRKDLAYAMPAKKMIRAIKKSARHSLDGNHGKSVIGNGHAQGTGTARQAPAAGAIVSHDVKRRS